MSNICVNAVGRVSWVYLTVSVPSLTEIIYSVPGVFPETLANGKEKTCPVHPYVLEGELIEPPGFEPKKTL